MEFFSKYSSTFYRFFSYSLFAILFFYLLLRAYFVEPLHDEAATFLHFVEPGILWGPDMLVDANNHLLNSFLCRGLYMIFGDDMFFLRLPNVFAFILYFWGIVRLIKPLQINLSRVMLLMALTCIPFILEYFANARGYGLSLAFFVCSLVAIRRAATSKESKYVFVTYFFLLLTVYSNLTFLVSAMLAIVLFIVYQIIYNFEIRREDKKYFFLAHASFLVFLIPAFKFARILREGGALYYGSLDGFWRVSGTSLSQNVLFYSEDWLKWFFILTALGFILYLIHHWRYLGTWKFFKRSDTIVAWFLFGNCIAIVILAKLMNVNYPEDRVGMYLVILFMMLLGFILGNEKRTVWMMNLFLFFPLSLITNLSLSTSVFSPDDRMSEEFYGRIKKYVNKSTTVTGYPLMQLTWSLLDRNKGFETVLLTSKELNYASDIFLTKTSMLDNFKESLKDYDTIAYDQNSGFLGLIHKNPWKKTPLFKSKFESPRSNAEFLGIHNGMLADSLYEKQLQFRIRGDIKVSKYTRDFNVVISTFDKDSRPVRYIYFDERWTHGQEEEYKLNFNVAIDKLVDTEKEIRVYFWNPQGAEAEIKNGTFEILKLEKDGTR